MVDHAKIVERLAELRTTAEAASDGLWHVGTDPEDPDSGEAVRDQMLDVIAYAYVPADDRHIAAWSPAAVLRWLSWAEQVAARHRPVMTDKAGLPDWVAESFHPGPWCSHGETSSVLVHPRPYPCDELTGLAGALGLEET